MLCGWRGASCSASRTPGQIDGAPACRVGVVEAGAPGVSCPAFCRLVRTGPVPMPCQRAPAFRVTSKRENEQFTRSRSHAHRCRVTGSRSGTGRWIHQAAPAQGPSQDRRSNAFARHRHGSRYRAKGATVRRRSEFAGDGSVADLEAVSLVPRSSGEGRLHHRVPVAGAPRGMQGPADSVGAVPGAVDGCPAGRRSR